ncbi:AbrB/MazE/SpoVT family DNA-binding domain-containing protein [Candidatus Micrarchaeota archaeon]|nr:AbrB/MazE/SpoVT family DNA-binding domain-containing protein [Candidatus Micrarchaeota archaeon]
MRFFRHGEVLAISLPESLRKKLGLAEGQEYDFVEVQDGVLALVKSGLKLADVKQAVLKKTGPVSAPFSPLEPSGFLVLSGELDAKTFSSRHEAAIKSGDVKGVRGFDKKFYLVSRRFFETNARRILSALSEEKDSLELSQTLKLPEEGIKALLYVLKEEGEVIEKKRGAFRRVL